MKVISNKVFREGSETRIKDGVEITETEYVRRVELDTNPFKTYLTEEFFLSLLKKKGNMTQTGMGAYIEAIVLSNMKKLVRLDGQFKITVISPTKKQEDSIRTYITYPHKDDPYMMITEHGSFYTPAHFRKQILAISMSLESKGVIKRVYRGPSTSGRGRARAGSRHTITYKLIEQLED